MDGITEEELAELRRPISLQEVLDDVYPTSVRITVAEFSVLFKTVKARAIRYKWPRDKFMIKLAEATTLCKQRKWRENEKAQQKAHPR